MFLKKIQIFFLLFICVDPIIKLCLCQLSPLQFQQQQQQQQAGKMPAFLKIYTRIFT
jgi:hypothetical protein